jgi:hypothetical protein
MRMNMNLDKNINYIASGLERSGTSMLMQILRAGGIPVNYDNSRPADTNNPRGYYELEGGKIINKLMNREFPFDSYKGMFIKITAFGLQFLPPGRYKVIYSERNIEEILDSMEKMIGQKDKNRDETKISFLKLNNMIKQYIQERNDMDVLIINYNDILINSEENIRKIAAFLDISEKIVDKMISAVDKKLYRQRRV